MPPCHKLAYQLIQCPSRKPIWPAIQQVTYLQGTNAFFEQSISSTMLGIVSAAAAGQQQIWTLCSVSSRGHRIFRLQQTDLSSDTFSGVAMPWPMISHRVRGKFITNDRHWHRIVVMNMEVSWNRGTPKSTKLMAFAMINHPFGGTTIYGKPHLGE